MALLASLGFLAKPARIPATGVAPRGAGPIGHGARSTPSSRLGIGDSDSADSRTDFWQTVYYPDARVVCDENRDEDQWQDRPAFIVEVLGESTRRTDPAESGTPISRFRVCASSFAEPDRPALIVHRHAMDGGFVREDCAGLDAVLLLPEIDSSLPLAELYEGIEF